MGRANHRRANRAHVKSLDKVRLAKRSSLGRRSTYRLADADAVPGLFDNPTAMEAEAARLPMAIVNRGRTRADALAKLKVAGDCSDLLARAASLLTGKVMRQPGGVPHASR